MINKAEAIKAIGAGAELRYYGSRMGSKTFATINGETVRVDVARSLMREKMEMKSKVAGLSVWVKK